MPAGKTARGGPVERVVADRTRLNLRGRGEEVHVEAEEGRDAAEDETREEAEEEKEAAEEEGGDGAPIANRQARGQDGGRAHL